MSDLPEPPRTAADGEEEGRIMAEALEVVTVCGREFRVGAWYAASPKVARCRAGPMRFLGFEPAPLTGHGRRPGMGFPNGLVRARRPAGTVALFDAAVWSKRAGEELGADG